MDPAFFEEFRHFVTTALAYALALVVIILLLGLVRRIGWRLPMELGGFLERLIDTGRKVPEPGVNVEYRDASGAAIDLGTLVKATLRNGRGGSFQLHEGFFADCSPERIKAGTVGVVSIQDGLVKETIVVRLDLAKQVLFIESNFTRDQLLEQINRKGKTL